MCEARQWEGYWRPMARVTEKPQSPPWVTDACFRGEVVWGGEVRLTVIIISQLKHELVTCFGVFYNIESQCLF